MFLSLSPKVSQKKCNRIPVPQGRTIAFFQFVGYSRAFHVATIVHVVVHTIWPHVYTMSVSVDHSL